MDQGELLTAVGELDKYCLLSGDSEPGPPETVAIWTTVALEPEFLRSVHTNLTDVGWKTLEDYIRARGLNVGERVAHSLWIRAVRRLPVEGTPIGEVVINDESKEWPCFIFCGKFGIGH